MTSAHLSMADTTALTRRVTAMSVLTALILSVMKAVAWWMSGSVALLASLADSGLDLVASLITFFAVRYAAAPPDAEHRFGHGKAEAFSSLIQAGLVFASGALVAREAVGRLIAPEPVRQEAWGIGVMLASIALTAVLITAQSRVLRQASSVAVSGNRAHYASDLASNAAALLGIALASTLGWGWADPVAGLIVAAILVWSAVGVFRDASNQLMDHELPEKDRAKIVSLVTNDPRVTDVHQLRTRASGPYVHMQMHVDLDPDLSLEAAHTVLVEAENRVLSEFPAADVIMHADPRGRAEPHGGQFGEAHDVGEIEV